MRGRQVISSVVLPVLAFILLEFCIAASADNQQNDLVVGTRGPNDVLLASKHVQVKWRLFTPVLETLTFAGQNTVRISQVECLDLHDNGKGALPSIVKGGPGHSYVTIQLHSLWNRGIDFMIKICHIKCRREPELP